VSDVEAVLSGAAGVLLDFDGPVCSVFAGMPAAKVAAQLRVLVGDVGAPESDDPFAVLRFAVSLGQDVANRVGRALRQLELEAVVSAAPTPGAEEFLRALVASGRHVAIVSNNSAEACGTI
jgi:phosphoglycolate phosphatase